MSAASYGGVYTKGLARQKVGATRRDGYKLSMDGNIRCCRPLSLYPLRRSRLLSGQSLVGPEHNYQRFPNGGPWPPGGPWPCSRGATELREESKYIYLKKKYIYIINPFPQGKRSGRFLREGDRYQNYEKC